MALNFDRLRRRQQRGSNRFDDMPGRLNALRLRLRRSPKGLALGVFAGIAESLGFSVCWTRILGCFFLLSISGGHGHSDLLVAGFFYLLAAVLMRPPHARIAGNAIDPEEEVGGADGPPSFATRASARRPAAVPFQQVPRAPRVDFAELDRQAERLNRRIQRMEAIVTDRNYDWERRMES